MSVTKEIYPNFVLIYLVGAVLPTDWRWPGVRCQGSELSSFLEIFWIVDQKDEGNAKLDGGNNLNWVDIMAFLPERNGKWLLSSLSSIASSMMSFSWRRKLYLLDCYSIIIKNTESSQQKMKS